MIRGVEGGLPYAQVSLARLAVPPRLAPWRADITCYALMIQLLGDPTTSHRTFGAPAGRQLESQVISTGDAMPLRRVVGWVTLAVLGWTAAAGGAPQSASGDDLYRLTERAIARRAWSEAERHLTRLAALRQDDPEVHNLLGRVRAERHDFVGAADSFAAALRIRPDARETRYNLALAHYRAGAPARALEAFRGFEEASLSPGECALLGSVFVDMEDYDRAVSLLERAWKAKPDAHASYDLAITLLKAKQDRRAVELLAWARGKFRDDADLLLASAVAAYAGGAGTEAEDYLNQALARAPDAKRRVLLLSTMGDLYNSMAASDGAENAYRRALGLDPTDASLLARLGALLLNRNRVSEAQRTLQRALAQDSTNAGACLELGRLHLRSEKFIEARRYLECAVRSNRNSLEGHFMLWNVYRKLGEGALAEKTFARWQELKKEQEGAYGAAPASAAPKPN
ncbi:MAG: hypothetical protein DMG07_09055 [Acidobacteria bacterium]|nr:MAG: hypothetical protein DMG07_09055 [Acidobacteriota bacterium]